MSTFKKASMLIAIAVAMSASTALAQRDAGAKARGEFGTGFWSTPSVTRTFTYRVPTYVAPAPTVVRTAPAVPAAPQVAQMPTDRRSFSVEPNAATAGSDCPIPPVMVTQRPSVRRSFSYEPTPQANYAAPVYGGMRRNVARVPSYMLPKTDPGKFGR
jgi:hypothetical protein